MEIIIEISLCTNLFINSFILKLTGYFIRQNPKLWLLSSFLGAVISIITPLFFLSVLSKIILQICVAFLMISISFNFKNSFKNFLFIFTVFLLTTFIFGGGCYALQNIIGQIPLFVIAIFCSFVYFLIKVIFRIQNKKNIVSNFTYKVRLVDGKKEIVEEGFLDSGNMLYDTITKQPVILITYKVFHKLYDNISLMSILTKTLNESSIKNGHYIKINGIGQGTSILVFTIDKLYVGENHFFKNVMLGLSFSGFEKSFGKEILLHSELI